MPMVERDPATGDLRLLGELDYTSVSVMRAELAVQMYDAGPHRVDLSTLKLLAPAGIELLEELLDDEVRLRCSVGSPAYETLAAAGLLDRVEIVAAG